MSKKKKKKKKSPNSTKRIKRPTNFATPVECVSWIKKSVYLIARGRALNPEKPNELKFFTIGTGCVVAPNRMITAAHVINDTNSKEEIKQHKLGDKYYLIKSDDEGNYHYRFFTPELNKSLFIYPEVDLGVIYLEDEFYQDGDQVYALEDDYIRVDQKFQMIGTEIAVLGYPLCKLDFSDKDLNKPKVEDILLRADIGVINCRYRLTESAYLYEFTVAFNPGNSGGPIFNHRTGQLLSIVHGYKSTPINMREHILTDNEKKDFKKYTEESFIDMAYANYSVGYATPSFIEIFRQHQIIV